MKAGIVGYGLAGRYFHAPTLLSAGFEVAAVCTRSLERKAAAHSDFPSAVIVNSLEELLDEDLDLVVIASTNEVHVEQASATLRRGIPTVVDKPVGLNYYETASLFELSESLNIPLVAFFNRLWDSDALTVKKVIKDSVIGKPFRVDSRYERFRPEVNPNSWRETLSPEQGGGLLLDLQTHLISTALDWFGEAKLVYSSIKNVRGTSEDDVVLVLQHDSGVDSYLSVSSIVGASGPRLRLNGDQGSLVIQELDLQESFLRKGFLPKAGEWISPSEITSEARIYKGDSSFNYPGVAGSYPEFYSLVRDSLRSGSAMPVSPELALNVARIIDQAREINIQS